MNNKDNNSLESTAISGATKKGVTKSIIVLFLFVCGLFLAISCGRLFFPWLTGANYVVKHKRISPSSISDLQKKLEDKGLFDIAVNAKIPAIVFARYPAGLQDVSSVSEKKKIFFNTLLPAALVAQEEVTLERNFILKVVAKIGKDSRNIFFKEDELAWQIDLSRAQRRQLLSLVEKYKTDNAKELLIRVDRVPVSILLAQAAIESAWGSSRFAVQGNNLYGIWTWDGKGMVPERREKGKTHKVAVYDDLLDATRAYTLMLNRRPAYTKFRELRRSSDKPLVMVNGLLNYSSRRMQYVNDVKNMLRENQLFRFDTCVLDV